MFDAGSATSWSNVFWNIIKPGGTNLDISILTGNTPVPDGTWTNFTSVKNGGQINVISRYIQYSVAIATTDNVATAILQNILFTCNFDLHVSPVVLTAVVEEKDAQLQWSTETEYNNLGFEIQRSINGTDWTTISFVNGAGISTIHID